MAILKEEIEFLLKKQRQSVLHKCKDDVLKLRAHGVTLSSIRDWLKDKKNIETSCENIRQFCLRNTQKNVDNNQKKEVKSNSKKLFENIHKD